MNAKGWFIVEVLGALLIIYLFFRWLGNRNTVAAPGNNSLSCGCGGSQSLDPATTTPTTGVSAGSAEITASNTLVPLFPRILPPSGGSVRPIIAYN